MRKTVLITGAMGFIGKHLLEHLVAQYFTEVDLIIATSRDLQYPTLFKYPQGHIVLWEELDITDNEQIRGILQKYQPEIIINLAGVSEVKYSDTRTTKVNLLGVHNLLEYCPEDCLFVQASSATVYGDVDKPSVEEDPKKSTSIYSITKSAAEDIILNYEKKGKIRPLICRLVANVGLTATHGVLRDFIQKARNNNPTFPILGLSKKPYIHVIDTVRAITHLIFGEFPGIFNISNRGQVHVKNIYGYVLSAFHVNKSIEYTNNWSDDILDVQVSNNRLLNTGFCYKYPSSKEAILQAIKEYQEGRD